MVESEGQSELATVVGHLVDLLSLHPRLLPSSLPVSPPIGPMLHRGMP
jgi:hypothetical protein